MTNVENPLFVQEEIPIRDESVHEFMIEAVTGHTFVIHDGIQSPEGFKSYLLTYDRAARRIRQQQYNPEGKIIYDWIYDQNGRPVQETAYEVSGQTNYRLQFVYDHSEHWIEKRMYLGSGALNYRIVSNRDADGRIIAASYFDSSGQSIRADSYVYDDQGRLIRLSMGPMGEWIYEYDENDNLKSRSGTLTGTSLFGEDSVFEYNPRGLLIRARHLHRSTVVFEYSFY